LVAATALSRHLLHRLRYLAAQNILHDNVNAGEGADGAHDGGVNAAEALRVHDAQAVGGDADQNSSFDVGHS